MRRSVVAVGEVVEAAVAAAAAAVAVRRRTWARAGEARWARVEMTRRSLSTGHPRSTWKRPKTRRRRRRSRRTCGRRGCGIRSCS